MGEAMDKTFDLLGVHAGLKYKDAAHPLKGGKIQIKIDDLKKIFKQAHSNKVEVDVEFDGGVAMDDGLFKMVAHYSMVHSDGEGEEKGEVMIERKQTGGMWTTTIKTTASPFGGKALFPAAINNLKIMVESDRQTKFHAMYVNPTKSRDMHINIDRVPGKSLHLVIVNGARKHDLTFKVGDLNFKKMDGIFNIAVEGTSLGEAIKGKVTGSKKGDTQVVQFELEKGNKKFIQLDTKIRMDIGKQTFEARTKYAVLGGKIAGKILLKYGNKLFTFKNTDSASKDSLELTAKIDVGHTADIEAKKNGESMWTYKTKRTTVSDATKFEMTLDTEMTLSSSSMVHKFLSAKYPYGAFNTRNNKVKIFVDKKNKNLLAPKFKIDVHLQKDGDNAVNGRDVSLMVQKGGVQMFKITWSTEKINNANEFRFILHDTLDVNSESMLYKNIISQYKILTPFTSRIGEFEIYVNKKDKNLVLNKFYAKGNVMKDGNKRFDFLLSTNEKPYKFELFAPSLLGKLKPGMTEAKISADHNPGQSLEIKTNFEKFTGLKIYKS